MQRLGIVMLAHLSVFVLKRNIIEYRDLFDSKSYRNCIP